MTRVHGGDRAVARSMDLAGEQAMIDRRESWRGEPEIVERLSTTPATRVVTLWRGRARLDDTTALVLDDVGDAEPVALLGSYPGREAAILLAIADDSLAQSLAPPDDWREFRLVGGALTAADRELWLEALALAGWIASHMYCPECGTAATLHAAGWARRCPSCGREHFPRTDPAIIAAVSDDSGGRLLLGANAAWPAGRFSCFAGFIEAGESAEQALARELGEEAGIRLSRVEYRGSQAWPYPRSLMLGYLVTAVDAAEARPDAAEINEVRWFGPDEIGAALRGEGEVTLPGPASIAHRLIVEWHRRATLGAARAGTA